MPTSVSLKTNLTRRMFKIVEAGTGDEALRQPRRETPNLILLDLHLPDMNGTDILTVLQQEFSDSKFPVIVISAWLEEQVKAVRAFPHVVEVLSKPVTQTRLLESIRRAIMDNPIN